MDFVDGPVPLGEWMPDATDLKFPNLHSVNRIEPVGLVYKSFEPLVDTGGPVLPGGNPFGFSSALRSTAAGDVEYFYGATTRLYLSTAGGSYTAKSATLAATTSVDFLQISEQMIAAIEGVGVFQHIMTSPIDFATLGSATGVAPRGSRLGKINQFLIVANSVTSGPLHMQWSGIDDIDSWPTPNSATAIAQQSGEQFFDAQFGEITGIANGDQFGLVFQKSAITRVSYAGPPVVFQFDRISENIGCPYPRSIVQAGGVTYFLSAKGFFRTDGVTIEDIGLNKVNRYFLGRHAAADAARLRVYGAYNRRRNLIYWTYCNTSSSTFVPSDVLIYSTTENRFTQASQTCEGIFGSNNASVVTNPNIYGYGSSNTLGSFQSGTTGGVASIETGDIEFNPGGFSHLSGAKLLVDQTAGAIVAYSKIRNEFVSNQLTTSAASTTTAATGFADFRRESRYHRALFEITGVFNQAQAMEFKVKKSGGR